MPFLLSVPVPWVVAPFVAGALLSLTGALLWRRQPWAAVPAGLAGLLAGTILLAAPPARAVPQGSPLPNVGGGANFARFHDAFRAYLGNPVGECSMRYAIMACWTVYARPEFHPEHTDTRYQIELGNCGLELLEARGLAVELRPVVPTNVLVFLAAETNRAIDVEYWFGPPITNPRVEGERTEQYFMKTIVSWPTDSTDPADIRREPVGAESWHLDHTGEDARHPDPWTPLRIGLLLAAGGALLASIVLLALPGRFHRSGDWDRL